MTQEKRIKCAAPAWGEDKEHQPKPCPLAPPAVAWALWLKLRVIFSMAVEPVMLLDGLGYSVMIVFVENLQMDKICLVNLNLTSEMCANLSHYPEENIKMQQAFSMFGMYNGIIMAFLPLFFILFMGAWSDKYGRKVPLYIATLGHFCWAFGYLLNSWVTEWPVEYLLVAALMDSLGGGTVSFLTAANAYISDVTSEETRTMRVGLANSIWYLGGPIGTLMGTYIYKYGGYQVLFGTSVLMHCVSLIYLVFLPESHGPFAKSKLSKKTEEQVSGEKPTSVHVSMKKPKEIDESSNDISLWKMIADFFNYERIVDSFRCTFKARGGLVRAFILLLILCNLLRRLGRGAYMYLFTRRVLGWRETNYGLWVTYKNLLAALGSLVAVPLLSKVLGVSDNYLAMLGALASVADYSLYGLVSKDAEFLVWIAPVGAILVNSCVIAIRSMLSKFVTGDELGKVSAVMGALDGVMPMISFSLYTAIYHATVHVFPGAQFFFGAAANLLMTFIFVFIIVCTTTRSYTIDDLNSSEGQSGVEATSLRFFSDRRNRHLQPASKKHDPNDLDAQRTSLVLSGVNFHIGTPIQEKKDLQQGKTQRDRTSSLSTITEISNLDRKMIEDELTFPQRHSSKKLLESKKEETTGIDNPAYSMTEEASASLPSEEASVSEVVLSPSDLVAKDEPEEASP
ncbi:probable peptidoglycan muropeptide transporter SLC46 isoform X2 [Panulirus ornatus]|uniref:probable peptidoglycan muropeptide transporter SLC46 isoform X2 n=1 Tax=Panulirus ornatus TaxID=150431 RepID=UPI003A8B33C5